MKKLVRNVNFDLGVDKEVNLKIHSMLKKAKVCVINHHNNIKCRLKDQRNRVIALALNNESREQLAEPAILDIDNQLSDLYQGSRLLLEKIDLICDGLDNAKSEKEQKLLHADAFELARDVLQMY